MPSGLTAPVQRGDVTSLYDFAMVCARGTMVCITMRDDDPNLPPPDEFTPSDFHLQAGGKAELELHRLQSMTPAEVEQEYERHYAEKLRIQQTELERAAAERQRYEAMLAKVQEWSPPQEYAEFKSMMIKQLVDSLRSDCESTEEYFRTYAKRDKPGAWYAERIESLTEDLIRHKREYAAEVQRAKMRTDWIRGLRAALA